MLHIIHHRGGYAIVPSSLLPAVPLGRQVKLFFQIHQITSLFTIFYLMIFALGSFLTQPLSVFATIASIPLHPLDALPDHPVHPKACSTSDLHTAEVCLH
jgi:hypothetical protein